MSTHSDTPSRRGFTLVELLVVVTVIVLLATFMIGIRSVNPDGLASGQRMLADMLRVARVQAMMNRAAMPRPAGLPATWNWAPANFRYRVLIKCDPTDPDTHLREMVVAIGLCGISSNSSNLATECWFSPEPPVRLPPGIFFVPPNLAVANGMTGSPIPAVTMPAGTSLAGNSVSTRMSMMPPLVDTTNLANSTATYDYTGSATTTTAPMMLYRPTYTAVLGTGTTAQTIPANFAAVHAATVGGKYWYYVELGPDGSNNHTGKVVLVLAEGVNTGKGVLLTSPDKFAGILVRRNGDVSLTTDTSDLESTGTSTLLK